MIFIGGAIAWITIGRSMKGVLLVTKAAGEFGHGDLKARVSWTGKGNEIEELIAHFNQMATQTESLIKEMGEITNNIAHDLRTPVTRMRGLAENTLTKNPENSLLASNVIEECERQAAIIEDTLSLAESQAGVLKLKLQKCHINELLTEMAEIYQPLLEQEESKFSTLLPQSPIYLFIDPRRVQRVIANLLDNAIKYAPKSTITLSLIETTEQVEIRVTDNGPGIPQQDRDNIFKRFFRADKSRNSTGSGLGLSLARSYMENHGGTLELENTNDGCSFLICFPKNK
jgi:signal transduction histidine kinase